MKKGSGKFKNKVNNMVSGLKLTKKKFNSVELFLVVIMALILGVLSGELIFDGKSTSSNELMEVESTYKRLLSDYYGEVDSKKLSDAAISGMMSAVDDKYSAYFNEEESEQFNTELNGSFIGLGATIGLNKENKPIIVEIIENTPAQRANLKVNDRIISINNKNVEKLSIAEISSMIKGDTPKNVSMIVERENEGKVTIKFTTGKVDIPSVTSEVITQGNKKIGYIYISIFALNTDEQFKSHLEKLEKQNIDSLIIDLRDNTGGHLETVQNIASQFLSKSQVVCQIKDKTTTKKLYSNGENKNRKYNVVVLTNSISASGSEVLAAALQEQYNAVIVGTKTYGKGTVQKMFTLSTGSSIKYTAEEWLTSKGKSINNKGITPDIVEELNEKYFTTYDKKDDNQYQKALSILESK